VPPRSRSQLGISHVHFPYELLLCLGAKIAVDGRLDLEEVLDDVSDVICSLSLVS
jgi:hypothetical protein